MALMDIYITSRVRLQDGLIYDVQCEFESEHGNISVGVIHDSIKEEEHFYIPIEFPHQWTTERSEKDFEKVAGWACRLYRDLPTNHTFGSGNPYKPDGATLNRLLKPGKKNREIVDRELLQLLNDFYVADSRHEITVLSIFMSLEIEKEQILARLDHFQDREWIEVSAYNDNIWFRGYSISAQGIEKIEERLKQNMQYESRYFTEVDIQHTGDFIFVIMPFKEKEFDQTIYYDFINPIVKKELSIECVRVDDDLIPERIDNKIFTYIKKAKFLIAELTTNNANVIYELAMAHMLNKRVIILTQNDPPNLPFDFDKFPATIYNKKEELKTILPKILKTTSKHS